MCLHALNENLDKLLLKLWPVGLWGMRILLAVVFFAHGMNKFNGMFNGNTFDQTVQAFDGMGMSPGWFWGGLAGGGELLGGLMMMFNPLVRFGAFLIFVCMAVAVFWVHWDAGFFMADNGYEYALTLMMMSFFFIMNGSYERKI
jgi:putative oxidoreductase